MNRCRWPDNGIERHAALCVCFLLFTRRFKKKKISYTYTNGHRQAGPSFRGEIKFRFWQWKCLVITTSKTKQKKWHKRKKLEKKILNPIRIVTISRVNHHQLNEMKRPYVVLLSMQIMGYRRFLMPPCFVLNAPDEIALGTLVKKKKQKKSWWNLNSLLVGISRSMDVITHI